jgi:hypothetical protein
VYVLGDLHDAVDGTGLDEEMARNIRYGPRPFRGLATPSLAGQMTSGGGRVPERVEVGCYAGGRGDETPRVVLLGEQEVTLRVERRWIEEPVGSSGGERRRMFQVQLEDGRRCRLAQEADGSWTLADTADGR